MLKQPGNYEAITRFRELVPVNNREDSPVKEKTIDYIKTSTKPFTSAHGTPVPFAQ